MAVETFELLMVDKFLEVCIIMVLFVPSDVIEYPTWIFDDIVLIVGEITDNFFGHRKKIELGTFLGFEGENGCGEEYKTKEKFRQHNDIINIQLI